MTLKNRLFAILLCFALVPSAALFATAQDQEADISGPPPAPADAPQQSDDRPDPPARAARLQYMTGSVSVQPHGTDEWAAGALNRPLTNADNIWADKDSRAEISAGTGVIRIGAESSLTLTNIDENSVQLQLHQGEMNLHVRRLYDNERYEVDTPNQAFTVSKPGDYRFDVDSDNNRTVITVWRGEGESTGSGPAVRIREGQQAKFGDGTNTDDADLHSAPSPDSFDEWARSRDDRTDRSASARYVSPDVVGYEDLDEYGTWKETDQYGAVWVPSSVSVGWTPYRNGHWIWVDPWGWTWVEDEPWGYAPFHYGRWVYYDNYWGWAPGPIYARPYYAPALVAWFGGGGWGVGFGGGWGGYGWCPLGFGEPFVPWYGVSRGYFNQVNITNTHITNVNITNIYNNTYINKRPGIGQPGGGGYPPTGGGPYGGPHNKMRYANMHNGFTAVSRQTLLNSQEVSRNALRVSPQQLSKMRPVNSLGMRPTRTTMLGPNAGMRAAAPPPRTFSRPVVSSGMRSSNRTEAGIGARPGLGGAQRPATPTNVGAQRPGMQVGIGAQRPSVQSGMGAQRPSVQSGIGAQRPMNLPNRSYGQPNSNMRGPSAMTPRSVPRPPSAVNYGGGMRAGMENRPNVSRPSTMSNTRPNTSGGINREGGSPMRPQSVPRPPSSYEANNRGYGNPSYGRSQPNSGSYNRPAPNSNRETPSYSRPQPNYGGGNYGRPAPSNNRETPSYSRPQPSYGGGSYSRPAPNYGGGSYGRPAPSYGGGSYSRPAPTYDRGAAGRSMPSYGGGSYGRPAPSYGGGGGHSMPSYGGGGGHASSYGGGGGGHSGGSGGGGGHASAPSGGGHSSSGGGNHGGRH